MLSGGGTAYKLNLGLIKPPSSWTSSSSSSSSASSSLSESNNPISARKARTPRKRPNQTYNEAAFLLSTAYPKLFPAKPFEHTKPLDHRKSPILFEPSDLLLPIKRIGEGRPNFSFGPRNSLNLFERPFPVNSLGGGASDEYDQEDLCILDEEIEDGIDSIMGNGSVESERNTDCSSGVELSNTCYPNGLGFQSGNGMRNDLRAMREVDGGDDWWRFPCVNLADITRKIAEIPVEKKNRKKKKENPDKVYSEVGFHQTSGSLGLKLNYEDVLSAWSNKGSPFSGKGPVAEEDVKAFPENGLSYNEKQHSHVFSKRIRHRVKKSEANQRPRLMGTFRRPPYSSMEDKT